MMVIKLNASGEIEWRDHFKGPGEGSCGFAITEATNGSLIVAGNSEGDGPNNEENYCFIQFSDQSACDGLVPNVLPNNGSDYVLSADETWTTDRVVDARVVVPAGITLYIKGTGSSKVTIRFADSKATSDFNNISPKGIRVMPGGALRTSYAILTGNNCEGDDKMWDGINIEGNPNFPLGNTSAAPDANQGKAWISRSDIINARHGTIATGMWYGTVTNTITLPDGSQSSQSTAALYHGTASGGYIFGVNSRWIDNKRSAIFMQYNHEWSKSRFWGCQFLSNGPLTDITEASSPLPNFPGIMGQKGSSIHVSVWSTRVTFLNCRFTGSTSVIPDFRPICLGGAEMTASLDQSSFFENARIGIECTSVVGSLLGNILSSGTTFQNVHQGINLKGTVADEVINNHFQAIPTQNLVNGVQPGGIFGDGNIGGLFFTNDFTGSDDILSVYGIVERNTGSGGALLSSNKFNSTLYGSRFEGVNSKLRTSCNEYTDMGYAAFSAVNVSNMGSLGDQGEPLTFGQKVYNRFYDECNDENNRSHIFAEFAFNYYDKTTNPYLPKEDCVSDIVNLDINSASGLEPCEEGRSGTEIDRLTWFLGTQRTLTDRNIALRELLHRGRDADSTARTPYYEDALTVLRTRNQPEDQRLLAGTLTAMGRYSEAQAALSLLNATDAESTGYKAYLQNILNAGGDVVAMDQSHYQTALQAETGAALYTRTLARNLRQQREGIEYLLIPTVSTGVGIGERSDRKNKPVQPILAQPNPFSQSLDFNLTGLEHGQTYQIDLFDLMGKQVASAQGIGGTRTTLVTSDLPQGQYFYRIYHDQQMADTGKVWKVNQ